MRPFCLIQPRSSPPTFGNIIYARFAKKLRIICKGNPSQGNAVASGGTRAALPAAAATHCGCLLARARRPEPPGEHLSYSEQASKYVVLETFFFSGVNLFSPRELLEGKSGKRPRLLGRKMHIVNRIYLPSYRINFSGNQAESENV